MPADARRSADILSAHGASEAMRRVAAVIRRR
jgi:hypothetical protein